MSSRSLFSILKDGAGLGDALRKIIKGDDLTVDKEGLLAFIFQDKDGNAVIPQLSDDGAIPVTPDFGTTLRGYGEILEGALSGENQEDTVASIALSPSTEYTCMNFFASCFRECEFKLVVVEDVGGADTETVLFLGRSSAGNPNVKGHLEKDTFTVGVAASNELRLIVRPKENKLDDVQGALSVNEI